jgi:beta-mannosidase
MASFYQETLSTGWSFKQSDHQNEDAWMLVSSIPSVVHQDLEANRM